MVADHHNNWCNKQLKEMGSRQEGLTFYEDKYIIPYRSKLRSHGCLSSHNNTPIPSAQSSPVLKSSSPSPQLPAELNTNHYENCEPKHTASLARPVSTPPTSNHRIPLYEQPVPYRSSIAANTESNNNHYELIVVSNVAKDSEIYSNRHYASVTSLPPRLTRQDATQASDDHIYEVIPPKKQTVIQPSNYTTHRTVSLDENNYCNYTTASTSNRCSDIDMARKRWNESHKSTTRPTSNLRAMKRIARSADSIRMLQHGHNRLRNQSTAIAPFLWVREKDEKRTVAAASCSSITDTVLGFGKLTHGFKSLDNEASSTESCATERLRSPDPRSRLNSAPSATNHYSRQRRSDDDVSRSQQSSSNSLTSTMSTGSRAGRASPRRFYHHERIKSSPDTITAPYENVQLKLSSTSSNYVNIEQQKTDLNYADLDLPPPNKTLGLLNRPAGTGTSTRLQTSNGTSKAKLSSDIDNDSVEYTVINFTATEAARKACIEQQRYREKRDQMRISSSPPQSLSNNT